MPGERTGVVQGSLLDSSTFCAPLAWAVRGARGWQDGDGSLPQAARFVFVLSVPMLAPRGTACGAGLTWSGEGCSEQTMSAG